MMKANTKYAVYEKYKESGIAWLGKIPIHWQVTLLKRRYQITLGKMLKSKQTAPDETEAPYLRAANIQWRGVDTSDVKRMWFTPEEKKKLQLCKGDLLVSEGGDVGRSALWNEEIEDCYIQNSINRIRAREDADTRFLYYWMYFIKHAGYIDMICNKATIAHFTVEKVGATPCVYPPLEEQNQIAAFLDTETAKMDALVEKQEQLITLLREKRQAIISHAVTKGLNPNAKMKDSGIEWLGEVPEHWVIGHLRWFITIKSGEGLSNSQFSKEILDGDSYPVIGGNGTMGYSKLFNTTQKAFAIGRVGALCGNVHFLKEKCWITDNALKISKWKGFNDSYFEYMLGAANLNQYANQSAQPLITGEQVKALPVPRLPLEEQQQIATYLGKETTKIDTLIEKCETAIDLLKERRTALIAAAVTGKIDMRKST